NPSEPKFTNGFYAFMLTRVITGVDKKNDAIIAYSQNPFKSTFEHNNQKTEREIAKFNGVNWELSIILGPFNSQKYCDEFCDKWLECTRGISSKLKRACKLQHQYGIPLYLNYCITKEELDHLIKTFPKNYRIS